MAKRKALPDLTCIVCGRLFSPTRSWHRFCSPTCRTAAQRGERATEYSCEYCGQVADTVDHVPPRTARPIMVEMGLDKKYPFVEVRACMECNGALGDRAIWTVHLRKLHVKKWLERRYAKYLRIPNWNEGELAKLSDVMRDCVEHGIDVRNFIRKRLEH